MIVKQDYAINADYTIGDLSTNHSFLLNGKPVGANYKAGDGINISEDNVISVDPNVLPEYTAGQGIAINNREISVANSEITPNNLDITEGTQSEKRPGGPAYVIDEWTESFNVWQDKYTYKGQQNSIAGVCTATIRRFSDNYQEATYIIKHHPSTDSQNPLTYFYLGIHDIDISGMHRTEIFNDRPFVVGYLTGTGVPDPFIYPHISITTHAGPTWAWDSNVQQSEQWSVDPSAPRGEIDRPKTITTHIGTMSVTKDLNQYTGFLYGLGLYAKDQSGNNVIYPRSAFTTIKISGRYRYHKF